MVSIQCVPPTEEENRGSAKGTPGTHLQRQEDAPSKAPEYPSGVLLVMTLISLTLGTFLMALDTTIVTVAIPKISTHFNALDQVGWFGSAYLITLTAFQPISGSLYKTFHPKTTYLAFMIVFEIGSTLCAAAPLSEVFILGRAIAGVGGAGLLQGALGIITFIAPLERRPLYMGAIFSAFGVTSSLGPVLGGVFTDRATWRWCFWINLPMGLVAFGLVLFTLRLKEASASPERQLPLSTKLRNLDPIGIILLLGFVACLCIALQEGGNSVPWDSAKAIGLLTGFTVIKTIFWAWQWYSGVKALIPVRFLTQRTVAFGSLFLFMDNMANYIKLYYLPFYFQAVLGTSAVHSGVNYISLAAPQFVALLLSGGLVTRFGYYMPVILTGQVLCVIASGLLTKLDINTTTAYWASFMALSGFGLGLGINAPHIAIQAVMETDADVFRANGVATFFSQLGGTISIPIGNALLLNGLGKYIPQYTEDIDVGTVIKSGPLAIETISSSLDMVHGIRLAYSKAIQHILILALAVVCASIPAASGMQWLNIRKVSEDREATGAKDASESSVKVGK